MAMHPLRKQRLQIICVLIVAVSIATGFIVYALRENINLFYPPADIAAGKVPVGKKIRAGGMVVENSIERDSESLKVRFKVTDYAATLDVLYVGILPDMFSEGQGVVVSGVLDESGLFNATEVLAKHDENYMPPEVAESLKKPSGVSNSPSQTGASNDS